jgi:hypothetical protein
LVPTSIAQQLFQPNTFDVEDEEAHRAEEVSIVHHGAVRTDGRSSPWRADEASEASR